MSHSTDRILLDFSYVRKLPVFITSSLTEVPLHRVFGYAIGERGEAMFPAFPPAVWSVLDDLESVFKDVVVFTPAAQAYVDKLRRDRAAYAALELPVEIDYVLPPFEHQHKALCFAYYKYRGCLGLTMGLGKSKVMIDLLRLLKHLEEPHKTLLLVPPHLINNWVDQFQTHSKPGELTVLAMADGNNSPFDPTSRREIYTGVFSRAVNPAWRYAQVYPDLYYEPIPDGLPQECYDIEREYVDAIVAEDSDARSKANAKLLRRSKKYEFERPSGTWQVLKPQLSARDADVIIISYDVATEDRQLIEANVPFNVLMMDESHYLRSISSTRSKAVSKLSKRAQRMVFASGSPSAGDPQHLYRMLDMICSSYIGDYIKFQRRYVIKRHTGFGVLGFKNLHILNEIMDECALMMDADDCVGLNLPPLNIVDVPVELDTATRGMYNQLVESHKAWITESNTLLETQYAAERITKLLQILSGFVIDTGKDSTICDGCVNLHACVEQDIKPYTKKCPIAPEAPKRELVQFKQQPKLARALGLIEDILVQPTSKVIVWCQFQGEVESLAEAFKQRKWDFARVDGSSTSPESERRRFNDDASCRIYLSNVAISEGFTINEANYTIYYGLTYNLVHYLQSMKRNHRIGQSRPVTVYRLYTPKTVHEGVRRALDLRQDIASTLCDVIRCSHCPHFSACQSNGTRPFDAGCIYDKKISKPTTKATLI